MTDTTNYIISRKSDADWQLLFNGKSVTENFPSEQAAIIFAEQLNQQNTIGSSF